MQLLQHVLELRRIEKFGLERSVEIDVFHRGEQRGFFVIRPAAVEQDERLSFVALIAQHIFEVQHVSVVQAEVIADADGAVDVRGDVQLAGLIEQNAEDVVLKCDVFLGRWDAAGVIFRVDRFGCGAWRVGEI